MITQLLNGFREIRNPLTIGYSTLFCLFLSFSNRTPGWFDVAGSEAEQAVVASYQEAPSSLQVTLISFAALIVGSTVWRAFAESWTRRIFERARVDFDGYLELATELADTEHPRVSISLSTAGGSVKGRRSGRSGSAATLVDSPISAHPEVVKATRTVEESKFRLVLLQSFLFIAFACFVSESWRIFALVALAAAFLGLDLLTLSRRVSQKVNGVAFKASLQKISRVSGKVESWRFTDEAKGQGRIAAETLSKEAEQCSHRPYQEIDAETLATWRGLLQQISDGSELILFNEEDDDPSVEPPSRLTNSLEDRKSSELSNRALDIANLKEELNALENLAKGRTPLLESKLPISLRRAWAKVKRKGADSNGAMPAGESHSTETD